MKESKRFSDTFIINVILTLLNLCKVGFKGVITVHYQVSILKSKKIERSLLSKPSLNLRLSVKHFNNTTLKNNIIDVVNHNIVHYENEDIKIRK